MNLKTVKLSKILMCLVFMCTVLYASANAEANPYLTAETEQTDEGWVIRIGIEENVGVSTFKLKIGYDKGIPQSVEPGTALSGGMLETSLESEGFSAETGEFTVIYVGTKNITDDVNLLNVYFSGENGEIPTVTVSAAENGVINEKFENISLKSAVSVQRGDKAETGSSGSGGSSSGTKVSVTSPESEAEEELKENKIWFKDVENGAWYSKSVEFMSENGYMNGTSEDMFSPDESLSRAMLVTVLWRVSEQAESEKAPFSDVEKDSWYEKAVNWAYANNIVNGIDEKNFAPHDKITREQIAAIMYRYAKNIGADKKYEGKEMSYADVNEISEYAKEAVSWCSKASLMNGKGNGIFAPHDNATRAEAAAILHRFIEADK